MRASRSSLVLVTALACAMAAGGSAWGAWSSAGTGSGTAAATSLQPPASASAAPTTGATSTSITVTWTVPSSGPSPTGYRVDRVSPAGTVCTVSSSTFTCNDTGRTPGTAYSYNVFSTITNWDTSFASPPSATTTGATDSAPPTVTQDCPTSGTTYTLKNPGNGSWTHECGSSLKVNITDASGVASAKFKLQQTDDAICWNGSTWSAANCSGGDGAGYFAATAPSSGNTWTLALAQSDLQTANPISNTIKNYTLSVRATDASAGANTTPAGSPFTVGFKTNDA